MVNKKIEESELLTENQKKLILFVLDIFLVAVSNP